MPGVLSILTNRDIDIPEDEMKKSSEIPKNYPVIFRRAVCIHSSLQFVDLMIQSLLYTHGFSTTPVLSSLETPPNGFSRLLESFQRIRTQLQSIFRSKYRNSISELALFVGMSPINPTYVYRIPINICEAEDSRHDFCGETCAELNDVERRGINRQLFMHSQNTEIMEKKLRAKNHRMFIFIKGADEMVNEEIEEGDPNFGTKLSKQYTFFHENCNCQGAPKPKVEGKWLRIVPFLIPGKE